MEKYINTPIDDKIVSELKAGDYVYLTGTVYTARDAAHKRLYEALQRGEDIPLELQNNIIYYLGPSPAREGQVIGSAGPTTSSRMDKYTPLLLEKGLKGMIGKGKRSDEVVHAQKSRSIFCGNWRSRSSIIQMHKKIRSNSLRRSWNGGNS